MSENADLLLLVHGPLQGQQWIPHSVAALTNDPKHAGQNLKETPLVPAFSPFDQGVNRSS